MQSLLGRIVEVVSDEARHKITFEPLCTLPDRKAPPEHLKNQKLTFERDVADAREIGEIGDTIVLTVKEARKFLWPLSITFRPGPLNFDLHLHWFKEEKPPQWTAQTGSKSWKGEWQRLGDLWHGELNISEWSKTNLSFEIKVTCDSLQAKRTIYRESSPKVFKIQTSNGEEFRQQNYWLIIGSTPQNGGALGKLLYPNSFGNYDNFLPSIELLQTIHYALDWGGHTDRFRTGWGEWKEMRDVKMEVVGAAREANTSRVTMQGEIEDGLRTQFSATLLDEWPLLLMRRDFSLHAKKEEKKDELKQPIDAMRLFQTGFRCAVKPDEKASRVWCRADGETVPFSLVREDEHQNYWHWKMENGFALFEQANRQEWLMYFFDPDNAPHLGLWRGAQVATLEPFWAGVPLKEGQSTGFSLGLAAGESGGTNEWGAWVACRAKRENHWHCALLARCFSSNVAAVFQIADQTQRVPLMPLFLPGIGTVYGATAQFPIDEKSDVFKAELESLQGGSHELI